MATKEQRKEAPSKPSRKEYANEIIIQSPLGGEITPAEVLARVFPVDKVYIRVDQNKPTGCVERKPGAWICGE